MNWDLVFQMSSAFALFGWLALLFLPRRARLQQLIRFSAVGALSLLYSVLIFVYFFRVRGGGFGSIDSVRALFGSDPILVAGWVHYLAFDLLTGTWLAERLDYQRVSRLIQVPILLATFLFGPFGLLLGIAPSPLQRGEHRFFEAEGRTV
jgi:hypothetical protein